MEDESISYFDSEKMQTQAVNVFYVHMQLSKHPLFRAKMASGDISDLTYDQIFYVLT